MKVQREVLIDDCRGSEDHGVEASKVSRIQEGGSARDPQWAPKTPATISDTGVGLRMRLSFGQGSQ